MIFLDVGTTIAIILMVLLLIVVIIIASSFRIVPQAHAVIVEKLGSYHTTWGTGIHFLIPFIYRASKPISLKEQVLDFDPQPVITKDNVTIQIDTVVFFSITDPKLFTYGVENPMSALEKLTATTLRNIIGDLELDTTLTSRDIINSKMRSLIDEATDAWGIKVTRVELKNIIPPKDIRDAMEKQMRAERERREAILIAEGEKSSAILRAEGFKQSKILEAEAKRRALIEEAQGQAEAILTVHRATAEGLRLLKEAGIDQSVLTLKSFDAWKELANGTATKIIIPSNFEGITSLVQTISEVTNK
ncbi:MAG TPA: SPFH domain-containing protein [Bacilli bacterium]|nr:SPFH domain-containing protein [Bacilli bacterium]HQA20216.1 SPFH domain-containing protein [Bacilli bacterium]HQD91891.1 SPFH domain-containing protein [Bacilli bacterium]